jgi:hypothetical protein
VGVVQHSYLLSKSKGVDRQTDGCASVSLVCQGSAQDCGTREGLGGIEGAHINPSHLEVDEQTEVRDIVGTQNAQKRV